MMSNRKPYRGYPAVMSS
ncbi:hypothetical protein CRUP_023579 [Coryphaenoides rupestris]|nr:hypothetical protein CRUP_023579 [Coryphaenoides rupestris]